MTGLRRFPKILADEVLSAFSNVRRLAPAVDITDLLSRYRRAQTKYIAEHGISGNYSPSSVPDPGPIPMKLRGPLQDLDEALRKLHHYNHGGQEDYLAEGVMRASNREIAGRSRKVDERRALHRTILKALERAKYSNSDNKKAIVLSLMSSLDVKEHKIREVITESGLARKKKLL